MKFFKGLLFAFITTMLVGLSVFTGWDSVFTSFLDTGWRLAALTIAWAFWWDYVSGK